MTLRNLIFHRNAKDSRCTYVPRIPASSKMFLQVTIWLSQSWGARKHWAKFPEVSLQCVPKMGVQKVWNLAEVIRQPPGR